MDSVPSRVVALADADPRDRSRIGGKGASLATMAGLGLPVPPAFIATTDLCREFLASSALPEETWAEIEAAVAGLGAGTGRSFGDAEGPLLVSVRSGAPVSMPGMMDTILNVGLTERTLPGLVALTGDEAFAWDSYCRLLKMFGETVRGLPSPLLAASRREAEAGLAPEAPRAERARAVAAALGAAIEAESGRPFPHSPLEQLRESVLAVLSSWEAPRAKRYRRHAGIDDDLGTAVIVQAMVFGNLDQRSGSGVAFTRDPTSGERTLYGDFLAGAQGEDVVSGEFDVGSLADFRAAAPDACAGLERAGAELERAYGDMCDIEFTVERGHLWVLQARAGQRTGIAEVRIAAEMLEEGAIDADTALDRISPSGLIRLAAPVFDPEAPRRVLGRGIAASPGAAVGVLATSARRAEELAAEGTAVILARPETSPDDIAGFIAAEGVMTARGGRASHAAVVARGLNLPAVCGVAGLEVGEEEIRLGDVTVREGEAISLDGAGGEVLAGSVPLVAPRLDQRVEALLAEFERRPRLPLLAEGGAEWANRALDPEGLTICASAAEVESAAAAGSPRVLVDLASGNDPQATLKRAAEIDPGRVEVLVKVTTEWPAAVRRLPAGPWAGIVAEPGSVLAARLLATSSQPTSKEGEKADGAEEEGA
ncbi:MAG TPA: pyruvate, phosphate dikinase [Solirubrobacterales bacterium]